jgi:Ca2+-binding EF-hand superfamily protein
MKTMISTAVAGVALAAAAPALAQAQAPIPAPAPQVQVRTQHLPMRVKTRTEVVAHVRDLFARLDTNRDGYITRDEANAAHQKMAGAMRQKFTKRFAERRGPMTAGGGFDRLDLNKDGVITRDEFAQARSTMREHRVLVMRDGDRGMGAVRGPGRQRLGLGGRMFEMADANRDGRVSLQEMTDSALRRFDGADANHDGQITPDERTQIRKVRIERRQAAR